MRLVVATAAAAVVGYFTGGTGALQTFALVYGATGFLDPNKKLTGPRLQDLKAPAASYGAAIPYVEGTPRLAGCFVYASEKREIANETTQGKGGPGVDSTTFTYEIDVGIMVASNQCTGIRRIFGNGKLIWSISEESDDDTLDASGDVIVDLANATISGGTTKYWRAIRFAGGQPDQLPDPMYETAVGVGNAPAYRGRSMVWIEGLNLGGSGQLPVLTFEVVGAGTDDDHNQVTILAEIPFDGSPDPGHDFTAGGAFVSNHCGPGFAIMIPAFTGGVGGSYFYVALQQTRTPGYHLGGVQQIVDDVDPVLNYSINVRGQSDEPAYFMVQGNTGLGAGPWRDAFNAPAEAIFKEDATNSFSRYEGDTLFLIKGESPFTTYPRGIGFGQVTTTTAYVPWSATKYDGNWLVIPDPPDGSVYIYDGDLAFVGTMTDPCVSGANNLITTDLLNGDLFMLDYNGTLFRWTGAVWEIWADGLITEHMGGGGYGVTIHDGDLYSLHSGAIDQQWTLYKVRARTQLTPDEPTLAEVVSRLCLRTGLLTADDIDVTDLEDDTVHAMAITQVSTTRVTIEMLMSAYLFESVEGEKLRFVKRGGASVMTIPYTHLAAGADGTEEPLPRKRTNDIEIAAQVTVKYANILNDFQDGAETSDRLVTESTAVALVELPIGFTPGEAKKLADANTMDLAVALEQIGPVSLPRIYAALEPTDVITVTAADGSTFRARIVKTKIGGGVNVHDLVLDDATVINSLAATDDDYAAQNLISVATTTDLEVIDTAPLRDEDSGPGEYIAIAAVGAWPGGVVQKSPDGVTFTEVLRGTNRSIIGTAQTVLTDWTGGNVFDEASTVTVDMGSDVLFSSTRAAMLASSAVNAMLIGGEAVQFRTATFQSPGVYKLTGFIRALLGTASFTTTHGPSERCVLLDTTLRRIAEQAVDVGVLKYWRAITFGQAAGTALVRQVEYEGVGLKPFAPVDLRHDRTDAHSSIKWHRRSRLSSTLLAPVEVPLGETVESYDIELRDPSDVLLDSATVSEPQYELSPFSTGDAFPAGVQVVGIKTIGGQYVAIKGNPEVENVPKTLASFNPANLFQVLESPPTFGSLRGFVNDGDTLYVCGANINYAVFPPTYGAGGGVMRLDRTTLGSIGASDLTYAGDVGSIAFDGANLWLSNPLSDTIVKLHPTTLAVLATYAVTGSPYGMAYAAGKLYIVCPGSGDLVRWDIATQTEDYRVAASARNWVYLNGSFLYLQDVFNALSIRDVTTGAEIAREDEITPVGMTVGYVTAFNGFMVFPNAKFIDGVIAERLLFVDATTGLPTANVLSPYSDLGVGYGNRFYHQMVAGSDGTTLYLTSGIEVVETRGFELGGTDLTGCTVTVWQNSSVIGRGYPASLVL